MVNKFKKAIIPVSFQIVTQENKKSFAFEIPDNIEEPFGYMVGIATISGPNANGHYFKDSLLKTKSSTIKNGFVNLYHNNNLIFGVINEGKYIEVEDSPNAKWEPGSACEFLATLWKREFPDRYETFKTGVKTGQLSLSMECYYKSSTWIWKGKEYSEKEAFDIGLIKYRGRLYEGSPVYEAFDENGFYFAGVGAVPNPAQPASIVKSVAEENINLVNYHDLLHKLYEQKDYTFMTEEQIIEQHRKIHQVYCGL